MTVRNPKSELTAAPRVSIIIVNWNGADDTAGCIESLKSLEYPDYEIIVVDNGSSGDDAGILEERFKARITLLRSDGNSGFAGGCNIGIRRALEDKSIGYVLLLNNDTIAEPGFLAELVKTAESDRAIGIVGGRILYQDDPDKIWYAGGRIDLIRGNGYHTDRAGRGPSRGVEADATFITGCMMLVRREVFEKAGLLREEYFLSVEDTDFCYRAMQAGYKLKVNLRSRILHKVSASRGGEGTPAEVYYVTRNRIYFMLHAVRRWRYTVPFTVFFGLSRALKACAWICGGRTDCLRAMLSGVCDATGGKMGRSAKAF